MPRARCEFSPGMLAVRRSLWLVEAKQRSCRARRGMQTGGACAPCRTQGTARRPLYYRGGEVGPERPLSKAEIVERIEKSGRCAKDLRCRALEGLDRPHCPCCCWWRRELSLAGKVLRQFHRKAENQIAILEAFQEAGWPERIESPFRSPMPYDPKHRTSDAVGELNEHQNSEWGQFSVERGTQAVLWELPD